MFLFFLGAPAADRARRARARQRAARRRSCAATATTIRATRAHAAAPRLATARRGRLPVVRHRRAVGVLPGDRPHAADRRDRPRLPDRLPRERAADPRQHRRARGQLRRRCSCSTTCTRRPATAAAVVYHAIALWIPAIWGTVAFIRLRRSRRAARRRARRARSTEQLRRGAAASDSLPPFASMHRPAVPCASASPRRALTAAAALASRSPRCGLAPAAGTVRRRSRVADTRQAAVNPITVSPLPGTPTPRRPPRSASSAATGTTVSDVKVVGSHSGSHSGRLEAYSTGTGESFIPSHAVRAGRARDGHARASARARRSSTVAHELQRRLPGARRARRSSRTTRATAAEVQHYRSAPPITPSTRRGSRRRRQRGATPGDFFLAPYQGAGTPGQR